MQKKILMLLFVSLIVTGCSLPQGGSSPTEPILPLTPTQLVIPTLTSLPSSPVVLPSTVPTTQIPQAPGAATSIPATQPQPSNGGSSPVINSGPSSGPYAVILVASIDVLNIRSGPGADKSIIGSLAYNETGITRLGSWSQVDDSAWVEIQSQAGVRGWVNSQFLTEYVAPSNTCDTKVLTLIGQFEQAITTSNGELLASLVSPVHGLDVWAYRSGNPVNFDAEHARWVFDSTFSHNWGTHPASGQEVTGAFHDTILPGLVDVFKVNHTTTCNDKTVSTYGEPWPVEYTNINVVKSYKPGSPGVDLDWRAWLIGTEYVSGKPYLFSLIQFIWVP